MYGMIAQKLIQMADTYAAESGLSDAESHQRDAGGQPTADGRLNLIKKILSQKFSVPLLASEVAYCDCRVCAGTGEWVLVLAGGYWLWRMSAVNAGYLLALVDGYWHWRVGTGFRG